MLGYFKAADTLQKVPALVRGAGLLAAAILLYLLGGFPPRSWGFLLQTLGQLAQLWAARGMAIVLPLGALILLCIALGVAWGALLVASTRLLWYGWQYWREQRRFATELHEAELLATHEARRRTSYPTPPPRPASRPRSSAPSRSASRTRTLSFPPLDSDPGLDTAADAPARSAWADLPTRIDLPAQIDFPADDEDLAEEEPESDHTTQQFESDALRMLVGSAIDPGIRRKLKPNEDHLLAIQRKRLRNGQPFGLFIVADGMGGHSNGREASRLVIQVFCDLAVPALMNSTETDEEFFTGLLRDALQHANLKLYQRNRAENADMGTTLTAALLIGDSAYVLNVGDSRTYLYRPATGLEQVTQDHSVVGRMVREGKITAEEVYSHPRRNQIYRCLGEKASVEADVFAVSVLAGDKLLLCSDGLWEMVRDPQIEQILGIDVEPEQTCQYLVQAALDGGGEDNVSVIVAQVLHTAA